MGLRMKTGYRVCDAMTKKPVVVSPDTTIQRCAQKMTINDVGSLLVKDTKLRGIITDEDIVRKIVSKGINPNATTVADHMATKLFTTTPEVDIFEALMLMMEEDIRQLPVMDEKNMIGLLTLKDILKLEPELFDLIVDKMNVKEEEHKPFENEGICEECGSYSRKLMVRIGALICKECIK